MNTEGPGTATVTRHILTWRRRKFKSEKLSSENLDLWTYKTKESFLSYASDIRCVQRAFWAQLLETVEVSFNSINTPLPPGAKLMEGVVWRCVAPLPPTPIPPKKTILGTPIRRASRGIGWIIYYLVNYSGYVL